MKHIKQFKKHQQAWAEFMQWSDKNLSFHQIGIRHSVTEDYVTILITEPELA